MAVEITITRPPAVWRDQLRAYKLVVDGYPLTSVHSDQTRSVQVREGTHRVWMSIDWARSRAVDLELREGERAVLTCRPNGPFLLSLLFTTLLRKRYIAIELERIEPAGAG